VISHSFGLEYRFELHCCDVWTDIVELEMPYLGQKSIHTLDISFFLLLLSLPHKHHHDFVMSSSAEYQVETSNGASKSRRY
jgi:hypothetical protein